MVDVSDHLPGLIHRPGVTTWKPAVDREIVADFVTYDDYIRSISEFKREASKMQESHWPPARLEAEELKLDRW